MTDTQPFTDAMYGYSVRVPSAWKPFHRTAAGEPQQRLSVATPNKGVLIVSVCQLPRAVTGPADFESVGENHVESIVNEYRSSLGLTTVLGEKKENQSDDHCLRFWQGTSAIHESMAPGMLLSLHAVSVGSDLMVNIVYASGTESVDEMRAVDGVMQSLSFVRDASRRIANRPLDPN